MESVEEDPDAQIATHEEVPDPDAQIATNEEVSADEDSVDDNGATELDPNDQPEENTPVHADLLDPEGTNPPLMPSITQATA